MSSKPRIIPILPIRTRVLCLANLLVGPGLNQLSDLLLKLAILLLEDPPGSGMVTDRLSQPYLNKTTGGLPEFRCIIMQTTVVTEQMA